MKVYILDNYDSFTFNLVHLIESLDVPYYLSRNDEVNYEQLESCSHLLIGPGPGLPEDSAQLMPCLRKSIELDQSILGVCLGMQALLINSGCEMKNLQNVQHGADEEISVDNNSVLFQGLDSNINVGRYHSWGFDVTSLSSFWHITSKAADGFIMAIERPEHKLFGVQFHPESIMTPQGRSIVQNWLNFQG